MMSRVGDPSERYTHIEAPDSMDVQVRAGEEVEETLEAAVAISRFRRIAEERAAEAKPAAMEVDTEAEHITEPAVDVVAMEEAEAEHTSVSAAEVEMIGEVQAVHDQEPAIDLRLDVADMYAEEPDLEDISLNTVRVEDMAEKLVEFSEQLKEEEAEKAVVGGESSTPRQKKRKRKLKMTTLPDTSLPQCRTPSLQILSTPPKSPSPPPSPKTTTVITATTIPTTTPTIIPTPIPKPTPSPQPIPVFTTTTTVTTPTIPIAAIRDFHFTAGTSSARPSGPVDEVASLRTEMRLMQDKMNRLEAENRVMRDLAKFHVAEFRALINDV